MTLSQLATQLLQEQGEKIGDTDYAAQLEIWARDAITELSIKTKFRMFWKQYSFNTVVGVSQYSLPAEFRDFKYVRFTDNDREIDQINPRRLVGYDLDLERTDRPMYWWMSDAATDSTELIQKIVLNPIPEAIYSINAPYYYHPTGLVSASVIPITEEALLVIKSRIRMQIHKVDKDWDSHNAERTQYNTDLQALIENERKPPARVLVAQPTDLPRRTGRPYRLRYPFE